LDLHVDDEVLDAIWLTLLKMTKEPVSFVDLDPVVPTVAVN
jgi:hypothetical protein